MSRGFTKVSLRFPLAAICGVGCALACSILIDNNLRGNDLWEERWLRLAITFGFGISLFILSELVSELLGGKSKPGSIIVSALSVCSLVLLYRWIPLEDGDNILNIFWIRLLMLSAIVHLGIAVTPYWSLKDSDVSLWEYNKQLFSKFLLSGFFSAVFYVGVLLALISIDELFGVEIDEENYGRIWFFCAFVLNTYLFLGAMPTSHERPVLSLDYPKWIHFFCKFILLPLVVIYFGILYAYALKIVFTWSWPNGMVGLPVFILAFTGGLTGLLVWPISRGESISAWAKSFWRFYFPLFIPLAILLLLALQRRIGDYGFTEIRYLGVILGIWILAICVNYAIRPTNSFKIIPWSLIALFLVLSVGPLSPSRVALNSQWNRLGEILTREGLLVDDTLTSNPHTVEEGTYQDVRSIVRYLRGGYGVEVFSPIIDGMDPDSRKDNSGKDWADLRHYQFSQVFLKFTGLISEGGPQQQHYEARLDDGVGTLITEPSEVFAFESFSSRGTYGEFFYKGQKIQITANANDAKLVFVNDSGQELGNLDFSSWIEDQRIQAFRTVGQDYEFMSQEELSFGINLESLGPVQLSARRLRFGWRNEKWSLMSGEFWILVPRD